jgi:3-oxoacyl-[acyl-carrier protein] reductase
MPGSPLPVLTSVAGRKKEIMAILDGQVALITGSSRGIGAAIAKLFAQNGALVAVHGRDVAAISAVRAEIEAAGGKALQVTGDVTSFEDLEAMRLQIEAEAQPVDLLVVNAGASRTRPGEPVEETSEEGWRVSIDTNLTSAFLTMKSFLPGMKSRGRGAVITISSAAARRPTAMSPLPYSVAKAGLQLLTQMVAMQAGPYGIRVNCIAPETILTEANKRQIPADVQLRLIQEHPIRRLGTPEDVADAALYLASAASGWVTGSTLDVAGGSVLR